MPTGDPVLDAMNKANEALARMMTQAGISIGAASMLDYLEKLREGADPDSCLASLSMLDEEQRASFKTLLQSHKDQLRKITGLELVSPHD